MSTYSLVQHRVAFPGRLVLAVLITAVAAVVVGAPALRMRGLFLAVTTLALAVAAPWLLSRPIFLDEDHVSPLLRRPTIGGVSLASQRTYYYLCLGLLVLADRRRGPGAAQRARPLAAGRARQRAGRRRRGAVADPDQAVRLRPLRRARRPGGRRARSGCSCSSRPDRFLATDSLIVVAIAVVGGLASITGTILGAPVRRRAPGVLPRQPRGRAAHQRRRAAGPAALLPRRARPDPVQRCATSRSAAAGRRRQPEVADAPAAPAARGRSPRRRPLAERAAPSRRRRSTMRSRVEEVSVRFGDRVVVDDVDLDGRHRARSSGSSAPTAPASRRS